jgi:hypothetical protein
MPSGRPPTSPPGGKTGRKPSGKAPTGSMPPGNAPSGEPPSGKPRGKAPLGPPPGQRIAAQEEVLKTAGVRGVGRGGRTTHVCARRWCNRPARADSG